MPMRTARASSGGGMITPVVLRDYQERAVQGRGGMGERRASHHRVHADRQRQDRGGDRAIRRTNARGKIGLVVHDRRVLVAQTVERFSRHGHSVGVLQGENTFVRAGRDDVVVASIQTRLSRWNTTG